MSNDMKSVIIPRSDQLNSDDLITGPITVKITGVTIRGGQEQPISVSYEGDGGKPYKPCKSMCRVMVTAWGADSKRYVGRSMKLYRDPKVKWAGMDVGGIRISHMTDIDESMTMALTATKGSRKPYTVNPLKNAAAQSPEPAMAGAVTSLPADSSAQAAPTVDEALLIKAQEFAECGLEKYGTWWKSLSKEQRHSIGEERHAKFKEIASKVPA